MTVAAFARRALLGTIPDTADLPALLAPDGSPERGAIKVTVRVPAVHALLLGKRARAADVSQGRYPAGLNEGTAVFRSPDRREALAALVRSTDELASLSSDLNAFMRLLRLGASEQLENYRARIFSLAADVHRHLEVAGRVLADAGGPAVARSIGSRRDKRR